MYLYSDYGNRIQVRIRDVNFLQQNYTNIYFLFNIQYT
jgi:hypothetical protein